MGVTRAEQEGFGQHCKCPLSLWSLPSRWFRVRLEPGAGSQPLAPYKETLSCAPPGEVNPSPQPAAQIPMSSPQPLGPQAHQEVQLPREMPLHIILKETAAQGHASQPFLPQPLAARSLGRKRPDWAQAYDHISVPLTEHTARLMLMGTGAVSAGAPSCSVGGLP